MKYYEKKKEEIKQRHQEYLDNYITELRRDVTEIKTRYKEDQQEELINKKKDVFSYNVKSLESDYIKEVQELIDLVEKEEELELLEKDIDKKQDKENQDNLTIEQKTLKSLNQLNKQIEKNTDLLILTERTKVFDEGYITETLQEQFNKEDKDIYNILVAKVKGLDKEIDTTDIKNVIDQLENNTPEKVFQRFKGNFKYEQSGGMGLPSFSQQKLNNILNEISNPYQSNKEGASNPYF